MEEQASISELVAECDKNSYVSIEITVEESSNDTPESVEDKNSDIESSCLERNTCEDQTGPLVSTLSSTAISVLKQYSLETITGSGDEMSHNTLIDHGEYLWIDLTELTQVIHCLREEGEKQNLI